jgi:GNAT superfamily N-acetyltransferase
MVTRRATSTPAPRIAGPGDIDTVADVIADAFAPLAVIRFLVPDPDRVRPVSRAWYRLHVEHAISGAGQVVMTEDNSAAAVWFDCTAAFSEPESYAKRLADLAGDDLSRFEHLDRQTDTNYPRDPHWHLLFLATRPGRQNQGLGSLLMDYTHIRLDAEGIPAYLEATGDENRWLYQRHGYHDMDPATFTVTDGTVLHRMWRPAEQQVQILTIQD